jgi:hypothetical protein
MLLFEFVPDRVHKPVCQQAQMQMCQARFICLVINRTKIKIGFQGAETAFNAFFVLFTFG